MNANLILICVHSRSFAANLVFRNRGSTLSLHARMPPVMFLTFLKPAWRRKSTALRAAHSALAVRHDFHGADRARSPAWADRPAGSAWRRECCRSDIRAARAHRCSWKLSPRSSFAFTSTGSISPSLARRHGRWLLLRHAAELLVVDQLGDGRMVAAHRAFRIAAQLQLAEAHGQRVVQHQAADQRLADAQDQLHGFGGLNQADDAGQNPSTPPSAQLGTRPGGGGSGYRQR